MYKKKRSFQIFYPKITILVSMLPICYIKLHVTYYLLIFVQQYLIIFFCSENIVLSNLKFHDILLTEFRCMYSKIKFRRNIKSMIFFKTIFIEISKNVQQWHIYLLSITGTRPNILKNCEISNENIVK